jgi:hypothetical protein
MTYILLSYIQHQHERSTNGRPTIVFFGDIEVAFPAVSGNNSSNRVSNIFNQNAELLC